LKDGVYSNLDFIIIILVIIIESYYGHPGHSCLYKGKASTKRAESRSSIVILLMQMQIIIINLSETARVVIGEFLSQPKG
jgi:hypothetical protein